MHKIDLHLHTQNLKSGDGIRRKISSENFGRKMYENNVSICSITNHNKFDLIEYNEIIDLYPDLTVFPGIELDVKFDGNQTKHIILIANSTVKNTFSDVFNEVNRDYDSFKIEYNDFISKIKKFNPKDLIIIPHYYYKEKERGLTSQQTAKLRDDCKEYIIILEPNDLRTMGIINGHNDLALFGSDVKSWSKYPEKELPEIKFHIDSFDKFYKLASEPHLFIKNLLYKSFSYEIKESSNQSKFKDLKSPIKIYNDINIIFGEKGAGKTKLIENYIVPTLNKEGQNIYFYEAKKYEDIYKKLINDVSENITISAEIKDRIKSNFEKIINYQESNPSNFINMYIELHKEEQRNVSALRIKKREASFSPTESLIHGKEIIKEIDRIFDSINKVKNINENTNRDDSDREALYRELIKLKQVILGEEQIKFLNSFTNKSIPKILESIKKSIQKQTGIVSRPSDIGFSRLVAKRLDRFKANNELKYDLNDIKQEKVFEFGTIPNKGQAKLKASIEVLSEDDIFVRGGPFTKNNIGDRRNLIKKINRFSLNQFKTIEDLFSHDERSLDIDNFLNEIIKKHTHILVKSSNGELRNYSPSDGEKAILSISGILENRQYDIYLFDEIERGLGNKYISNYLIPKLKELRDSGKT